MLARAIGAMLWLALSSDLAGAQSFDVQGEFSARGALVDMHKDQRSGPFSKSGAVDPLCGCKVDMSTLRVDDPFSCEPLRTSTADDDADMIALKIVDPTSAAEFLSCGREGSRFCVDPQTKLRLRGARCCKYDDTYQKILQDPYLTVFAPRIVARVVEGLRPVLVPSRSAAVDVCGVMIDRVAGTFAMPSFMRGYAARAWLHGSMSYKIDTGVSVGEAARLALEQPPIAYEVGLAVLGAKIAHKRHRAIEAQLEGLAPLDRRDRSKR